MNIKGVIKIKKNVAFMIPKLFGGGAERVIAILSLNFPQEYNTYIITYVDSEIKYKHQGNIINIDSKESKTFIGKIINTITRVYKIRKIKKKYNISKTISFLDNPNIINILSRYRDKVVVSIRNQKSKEIESSNKIGQKQTMKLLYNLANNVVAISDGVKSDLIENFSVKPEKVSVIYNPVDINYIDSAKDEDIEDKYRTIFNGNTIITSGRLTYQKGQWHLIRAFKKVKKVVPDANLIILGIGELEGKLRKLINDLNLNESVYLLGYQDNPFKFIKNSQIFVFPSLFEGFGNVVTESMACGTLVISSDCKSGPKEILNPSNIHENINDMFLGDYGILIPTCDGKESSSNEPLTREEEIMADSIIRVLKDSKLKEDYENKLRKRVNDFKASNIIDQWYDL